ncbi:MAG TPA: SDR family NAD(P)-dependent oxidoreductase [Usitatibacter sp.]|jgi:benzil reductase ((S)-benzoin forming)|nr:SDR family NAD(P)-dependent oxidoreductase [Usitatibacter sp.]
MNLYIVTGTRRGLGEALAKRITADKRNELIGISRPDVDLADPASIARAFEAIGRRIAATTYEKAVLINNAGVIEPVAPLDRADPGDIEHNLAVNLVAPMLLMRLFLGATEHVKVRRVINISSGAGRRPIFGWSAYCAAKAGLDMATRVVALEAQVRGLAIEAVSLAPGVIDTGMQGTVRSVSAEDFVDVERFRQMKAEGALRPADDVAADILAAERDGRLTGDDAVLDLRALAK